VPNFWADARPEQKKVLVTFPPLYSIAHAVAGDDAYVLCMLTTQGPHGYQGAPTDLFMVNKADLLVYNGLSLDDDFVDKMLRNQANPSLRRLNVGETLEETHADLLLKGDGKEHVLPDGRKHKHGEMDPHIWLGPDQAIEMTHIIAAKLAAIDPDKKSKYAERAKKFADEIKDKVQAYGHARFKDKSNKKIITMHEAFGYFAKAFQIEIVAAIQKNPGLDPDLASKAQLIKLCRDPNGPRVIAVEPQYSHNQAEALKADLARDKVNVEIISLDPLETADRQDGKFNPDPGYYIKKMRENIDTLAGALK
jgi:ABC-type Zn uptake system ZnuABC Zn-binding protein ZnuA